MRDEKKTSKEAAGDSFNDKHSNRSNGYNKSGKKNGNKNHNQSRSKQNGTQTKDSGEVFGSERSKSNVRGLTNFDVKNVDGTNDISWYAKNNQILADSASFSYNAAVGSPMHWVHNISQNAYSITQNGEYADTVPGIMKIQYVNYPGSSTDNNSAINIAADNIYSYVRHANSGHANYDSPDLMMYIMAIDSAYSFLAYGRRAYGTARLFNQKNYYYQRALIEAQGFDYEDLIANLSNFRLYLNTFAAKASAFAVPSAMPILQRHFFMCSNIYKDRDTEKSQLYIFVPAGFHYYGVFSDLPEPYKDAGALRFQLLPGQGHTGQQGKLTFSQFMAYGNELLDRLMNSEDIGIISGDILKAYQGKLWTLPVTPEEFVLMPVYNKEILSQIENSRQLPSSISAKIFQTQGSNLDALSIVQHPITGMIIADFESSAPGVLDVISNAINNIMATYSPVLSLDFDHPLPGDAMIATRLMQAWSFDPIASTLGQGLRGKWIPAVIPSEIVIQYSIFQYISNSLVEIKVQQYSSGSGGYSNLQTANIFSFSNFAHHPFLYWCRTDISADTDNNITDISISPFGVMGDIDTYRMMSVNEVTNINVTALLSMYDVPVIGAY
nr:MAG: putative capsid protein [Picobirnavirus sp.]